MIKIDEDGHMIRPNAHLVARGFGQQEGIDYSETFSPIVRSTIVLIALVINYYL